MRDLLQKAVRRLYPKLHIRTQIARLERDLRDIQSKRRTSTLTEEQRDNVRDLEHELIEFYDWQLEFEDRALIKKAAKMGVYLDEINFPNIDDPRNTGRYHRLGTFGSELLRDEFRRPLVKVMRERETSYRKERHERTEIYIKVITAAAGLVGTATGLVALLKK